MAVQSAWRTSSFPRPLTQRYSYTYHNTMLIFLIAIITSGRTFCLFFTCLLSVSLFVCLFIFVCLVGSTGSLLLCRLLSSRDVQALHCRGFSYCRARALGLWVSAVAAHGLSSFSSQALGHRLNCGAWA